MFTELFLLMIIVLTVEIRSRFWPHFPQGWEKTKRKCTIWLFKILGIHCQLKCITWERSYIYVTARVLHVVFCKGGNTFVIVQVVPMISFMKHSVYIVPRCYGQDDYLIPCAKSDLDGRVPRLTPRLVGWVGSIATHRTPTLRNSSDRKQRKISRAASASIKPAFEWCCT